MQPLHKMRLVAADVACSVVCLSVCWSHVCALQKRGLTRAGQRNHVLDGGKHPPRKRAMFLGYPAH